MDRDPRDPPAIPSIFDALRCTCGKAVGGVYCDGTHLRLPSPQVCNEGAGSTREGSDELRDPKRSADS